MKFGWIYSLAWMALIALSVPAWATESDLRAQFQAGDYRIVAEQSAQVGSADALSIGAEALNALVLLGEADDLNDTARAARFLAEQALEIDPTHKEAMVQYALSDGFVTRTSGTITAWRKKLPLQTRTTIETLMATVPDDPRGPALLGAWHFGVISKAGEGNGQKWYGANLADGRAHYATALTARPNDIIMNVNYAAALLDFDAEHFVDEARAHLQRADVAMPKSDLETRLQNRGRHLLALMGSDLKDARKDAGRFLEGKPSKKQAR